MIKISTGFEKEIQRAFIVLDLLIKNFENGTHSEFHVAFFQSYYLLNSNTEMMTRSHIKPMKFKEREL